MHSNKNNSDAIGNVDEPLESFFNGFYCDVHISQFERESERARERKREGGIITKLGKQLI